MVMLSRERRGVAARSPEKEEDVLKAQSEPRFASPHVHKASAFTCVLRIVEAHSACEKVSR